MAIEFALPEVSSIVGAVALGTAWLHAKMGKTEVAFAKHVGESDILHGIHSTRLDKLEPKVDGLIERVAKHSGEIEMRPKSDVLRALP